MSRFCLPMLPVRRVRRLVVALVVAACASAGAAPLDEYGVKAAFVYNFIQFVTWTDARLPAQGPIVACVLGDSPLARTLGALSQQPVKGRQLRVRTTDASSDLDVCHVVFVPAESSARMRELAVRYRGAAILFVSEAQDSPAFDAAINMSVLDNRVVFDINLKAAQAQSLTISSKLMALARRTLQ